MTRGIAGVVDGDAAISERARQLVGAVAQLSRIEWLEGREERVIRGPGPARLLEHLVPGISQSIAVKDVRHVKSVVAGCFHVIT
jgi:hypothetical protein